MTLAIGRCTGCKKKDVVRTGPYCLCSHCEAGLFIDAMLRHLAAMDFPKRKIRRGVPVVSDAELARFLDMSRNAVSKVRRTGISPSVREAWLHRWIDRGGPPLEWGASTEEDVP